MLMDNTNTSSFIQHSTLHKTHQPEPVFIIQDNFEARSYFTTNSQPVSMSWYRAPLWDLRPDITSCCLKIAVLFLWGTLSDERTDLHSHAITQWSESRRTRNHTLLSHLRLPQPRSRSRSYFTTDGQSVSMSWYRAPSWDLRPDITSCRLKIALLFLWGALSDGRTGL
jgi:hypothetical protein